MASLLVVGSEKDYSEKVMNIKTLLILNLFTACLNANEVLPFEDSLFPRLWGIKNSGQTIFIQDSDLSRQKISGTVGVDINYVDTDRFDGGEENIVVAVIDSGVDIAHPDLSGRIWYNKICIDAPNAKNLSCNGHNFLDNTNNVSDDVGHGTHVAGIIAGNRNKIGILGASDRRVKIMPLKVINKSVNSFVYNGKLITDVIADAMIFAIKNGASVINLSLGWPKIIDTPKIRQAFLLAEEKNITVIAAAGNNNKDLPTYPCAYESVICVGAHENQGRITEFSNHGSKVDLLAPGEYIVSTYPTALESRTLRIKNYESKRGTSQAAPYVAASVAKLKVFSPSISNDEIKSYLFSTTIGNKISDDRYTKFGRMDQMNFFDLAKKKSDLKLKFMPLLKNLTEVKFKKSDKKFSFILPIKNLGSENDVLSEVCISSSFESIILEDECFYNIDISKGKVANLDIRGKILDIEADSQIKFKISIQDKAYYTDVFFTRDLNSDFELLSLDVAGANFDEMVAISNGRKLSRMAKVMDKHRLQSSNEYFYLEKALQTEQKTTVSLLSKLGQEFKVRNINLPRLNRVLSIHRQDINLDGNLDYMVYALSFNKENLELFFYDQNLNPLFKNLSQWSWPLSTFEGLPIEGGMEKFEWIKIQTSLFGEILVPTIFRAYEMPELDNSKIILERVLGRRNHQYYLEPALENNLVKIKLRVVDSFLSIKKLKEDLKVSSSFDLELIKVLPSSFEESKSGIVKTIFRIFNGEVSQYFLWTKDLINHSKVVKIDATFPVEDQAIFPIIDTDSGKVLKETVLSSLMNRSKAYVQYLDLNLAPAFEFINSWDNPIVGVIATFKKINGQKIMAMENRYTVTFFNDNTKERFDLPIYRDSSFPGQNFSETLIPIIKGGNPGLYVNSTLILGDRLYSMLFSEQGLIRPMESSVAVPENCVPLSPEKLIGSSEFQFSFLCKESDAKVKIKLLPM